jgi:membrane associated rhomboid family serine protease
VHAGWLHWLKNALFLGLFGVYVERALGAWRWLAFYLASGLGAIGVHWAMSLTIQPSLYREGLVGASGAISGLVGYFALRFYRRRVRLVWASPNRWGLSVPMWVGVLAWVLLQGAGAILEAGQPTPSAIGYWAHLGGFATGLTLALLWGAGAQGEQEYLLECAERALQQGAAGDALRYLQQLPATDAPRVRYLQGAAWAMLGDPDEAAPCCARRCKAHWCGATILTPPTPPTSSASWTACTHSTRRPCRRCCALPNAVRSGRAPCAGWRR